MKVSFFGLAGALALSGLIFASDSYASSGALYTVVVGATDLNCDALETSADQNQTTYDSAFDQFTQDCPKYGRAASNMVKVQSASESKIRRIMQKKRAVRLQGTAKFYSCLQKAGGWCKIPAGYSAARWIDSRTCDDETAVTCPVYDTACCDNQQDGYYYAVRVDYCEGDRYGNTVVCQPRAAENATCKNLFSSVTRAERELDRKITNERKAVRTKLTALKRGITADCKTKAEALTTLGVTASTGLLKLTECIAGYDLEDDLANFRPVACQQAAPNVPGLPAIDYNGQCFE